MATVYKLKQTVDYAKDAIVSKTITEKDSGTVTLFSFDKGQAMSEHSAPFDAFVQVLEGQAAITISGGLNVVKEGEMIVMPANVPHALRADEKFKMMLIMVKA